MFLYQITYAAMKNSIWVAGQSLRVVSDADAQTAIDKAREHVLAQTDVTQFRLQNVAVISPVDLV